MRPANHKSYWKDTKIISLQKFAGIWEATFNNVLQRWTYYQFVGRLTQKKQKSIFQQIDLYIYTSSWYEIIDYLTIQQWHFIGL